jgi:acyl transferase domain-containing protein/phosphopantetheinyl transferase (holo-ACP synthase)
MSRCRPLDIAVVGLACRFPGARTATEFWENTVAARDCIRDVPPDRWDPAVFFDPASTASDRVYCKRGGYLDAPIGFDPVAHGVMPLAVAGGEPEQFLILDAAHAALADAGHPDGLTDGRRVEVIIGRGNYFNRGNLTRLQHGRIVAQTLAIIRQLHPEWTADDLEEVRADLKASLPPFEPGTIAAQVTNGTAGRVANRLDLSGASFVVDAASASTLVALDLGARALAEHRADLALVGGVYLQPDVDFPMVFCQLGALSHRGSARPFAADADGTLPGEGVGVVVLKRLSDAEQCGNRIYAVLKGVGLTSDGRGSSLAAPSARGHARALRRAYRQAGIDPATVGYLEGHGLGVPASDRAELRALRAVFPPRNANAGEAPCALGAASALIGHAMPAAGMAGLIKGVLALHHRVIPPTPHADNPHPLLSGEECPFALPRAARPWIHGGRATPRRAAVSAFGFAGINAHAVLEEHPSSADGFTPGCQERWDSEAILLSAPDRAGLVRRAQSLLAWLDHEPSALVPLKDLAFTLNTEAPGGTCRLGLVVDSTAALVDRLRATIEKLRNPTCNAIRDARGVYYWDQPLAAPGALAFVFAGEGAQYPGMLGDLCRHFPEVRAWFDTADRVAQEQGHRLAPSGPLFGSGGGGTDADVSLWSIGTAVNAVLSAHWALRTLLSQLAVRPDRVVGHSSGEILALAAAGVIHIDAAFSDRLAELGTIFERLEQTGRVPEAALVAIAADRARVEPVCRELGGLAIALDNCPHQVIVAGAEAAAAQLVERLRSQGVICEVLPFARAYHTEAFEAALGPIRTFFDALPMERPTVPIDSCAIAGPMPVEVDAIRRLAVEQWARPVAFRSTIEAMYDAGVRIFVEVGARGNLTGFIEDSLRGRPHFAVAPCLPRRAGLTQLNHLVAALFAQGVALRPDYLYARRRPREVDFGSEWPVNRVSELAVGFPQMRLSDGVVERLRGSGDRGGAPAFTRPPATRSQGERDLNARPALIRAHLRTMDAYLETQRQVMDAYLAARRLQTLSPRERVAEGPVRASAPSPPPPTAPMNPPAAPPPQGERDQRRRSAEQFLLDQVTRRTGYPRAMLRLDLDMEGDLGIDSIKRVEIFGELQAEGLVPANIDIDRLSRCRTLGEVIALLRPAGDPDSTTLSPGSWVGTIESIDPGRELVALRCLDVNDDPVAKQHTLGGRRVSVLDPDRLGLPVVPFTVMAEMLAQAAVVLVPGQVVVGLSDVQAHRWIRYEDEPITLEIRARRDPARPNEVRVAIYNRGTHGGNARRNGHRNGNGTAGATEGAVVEGRVLFDVQRQPGPPAPAWDIDEPRICRFEAGMIYRDQWLFHGPALQAVVGIGRIGPRAIEGTLRVLPRRALFRDGDATSLVTDPIVLDAYTHLLGCWGLDQYGDNEGDVIFPLRLAELAIFAGDPGEGADCACHITVCEIQRHRVRVDADIIAPDGRVWMRVTGWDDWRFYWPGRYRDHMRMLDRVRVSEPLPLPLVSPAAASGVEAVWLEPPSDFGKPVWRDVLEALHLSPAERTALKALGGPEARATLRLWGRVAAKDAVRTIWTAKGKPPVYPADLVIEPDPRGRPCVRSLLEPERTDLPAVSIAHTTGVAVAIASPDPRARVGIDVEPIAQRSSDFERLALFDAERTCLDTLAVEPGTGRAEWLARLWCAKEAVAKATGLGLVAGPASVAIVSADRTSGEVAVTLGPELGAHCPDLAGQRIRAVTARRGEYVWAWTVCERIN